MVKRSDLDRFRVIDAARKGLSVAAIVRQTRLLEDFVRRWATRTSVADKPRTGRPRKVTKELVKKVKKTMEGRHRRSLRKVAAQLSASVARIAYTTVRHAAQQAGLKPYHKPKKPALTDAQRAVRLAFAKKYMAYDWRRVLFTDETTIQLHGVPNRQNDVVWAESATDVPPVATHKYSSFVKFWGGIGCHGSTKLVVTKKPFNSEEYQRVLEEGLAGVDAQFGGAWELLQDGDRAHTARATAEWLAARNPPVTVLEGWPANSPDINVVENVWAPLKDRIAARQPKSKEQLIKFARQEWAKLGPDDFRKLIDSMSRRLSLVRGGPIKY